jgi:hypothetical protein
MATRTLRATDGVMPLSWEVTDTGPLVLLRLDATARGASWSKLLKAAPKATAWADGFVAGKERLGYRSDGEGRLDVEAVLARAQQPVRTEDRRDKAPCLELSGDRTRATLTMRTWYDDPVHELEVLAALCAGCPGLTDLAIDDPMAGSQHFDPYVATVLAHQPALTRFALLHDSDYCPEDTVSSAITWLEQPERVLEGLPALRELVLEVAILRRVGVLRHHGLTALRIKTSELGQGVAPALREAWLPALEVLHVDMLDAQRFSDPRMWRPWQPIFRGALGALREVAIVNSMDGDAIVEDLIGGVVPPELRRLELSRTRMSGRAALRLAAEARRFDHVKAIVLDGNPLDDAAVGALRIAFDERLAFTPAPPPGADEDELDR